MLLLVPAVVAAGLPGAPAANADCVGSGPVATDIPCEPPAVAARDGFLCGLARVDDPMFEGAQTGEIDGGPLVVDDRTTAEVESGTLTCTVQVNAGTHAGVDSGSVTGPTTHGVAVAGGTVSYAAHPDDNVYVCTQVATERGTRYWNSSNDPLVDGSWATDPATASCWLAFGTSRLGEETTPCKEITEIEILADSIICPTLATLLPPDGDIDGIWNCPPYEA